MISEWDIQNSNKYDFRYDVSADEIANYFYRNYHRQTSVYLCEFGIDGIRLDMIGVDCHKQKTRGFEFKVSAADFKADNKWRQYLKYCHTFSFACPYKIITTKDLPKNIGIFYFVKWRYRQPATYTTFHVDGFWGRRPRRREIEQEIYIQVISTLLNRAKWRLEEFF